MRENRVRLSSDIPLDEHIELKMMCAKDRLAIKDFVHAMILKGMKDFREERFKKRLKESIQQSKEGKARTISAIELDEMVRDAE